MSSIMRIHGANCRAWSKIWRTANSDPCRFGLVSLPYRRTEKLTAAELNDLTYSAFCGDDLMRALRDSVFPFPGGPVNHQQKVGGRWGRRINSPRRRMPRFHVIPRDLYIFSLVKNVAVSL